MPKMVLLAEFVSINGNDLSDHAVKCEVTAEVEEKDVTTFGSDGWKEVLGGLKSGGLALELKQDFAASALDSIMWPLLGQVVPFAVRPDQAVVGTSNPQYSGNLLVKAWNPLTGGVGDDATVSVSYPTSGAVTRATS